MLHLEVLKIGDFSPYFVTLEMGSVAHAGVLDRAYDSGEIALKRAEGLLLVLDTPKGIGFSPLI